MNRAEQNTRVAAKMYECRETLQRLTGDKYQERVAEYKRYVQGAMTKWSLPTLPAALKLCQAVDESITQMWLTAAAVEIIEGDGGDDGE